MVNQEQHKAECLKRWQTLEAEARQKWTDYRRKRLHRARLEQWLKQLDEMDERTIRAIYNNMRG